MLGRGVIAAAVAAFLLVLGCVLWPGERSGSTYASNSAAPAGGVVPLEGLPYRGLAIQIQRVDWTNEYKKSIDEIAAVGADSVSFVVDTRQENAASSRIYLDMRTTPSPEMLGQLIDHARSKHLRVILMPIVLLDVPGTKDWRGTIKPEHWDEWFGSYREMMTVFSWVAQAHGVDVLVVGSELVSSESNVEEWTRTIAMIRGIFKGHLTYSSNWDHYTTIPFWDELDLIGMNSYWKLGEDRNVKVTEIVNRWKEIQYGHAGKGDGLLDFVRKKGKPLLFLEAGWCSLANAADEPWDYTKTTEALDLELQRKLYQGFFEAWYGNGALGGFMMWDWPPLQGGATDKGYIPKGKPAEGVLREWFAKPRWEVK